MHLVQFQVGLVRTILSPTFVEIATCIEYIQKAPNIRERTGD